MMASPQPLVVIGAAIGLLDVIDLVDAVNKQSERFVVVGALDDDEALHGKDVGGVRVLGGLPMARSLRNVGFVFAICSYRLRLKRIDIWRSLGLDRDQFVSLIHPRADVSPRSVIGRGCTVYGNAFIANRATLGDFTVAYGSAFVSPHCIFDDFAMAAGLAFVGAGARLGVGAFAAGSASIAPGVSVGPGGMVALASAAFGDVPAGTTVLGNPARPVKTMPVPAHLLTT